MTTATLAGLAVALAWLLWAVRDRRRHMRDAANTLEHYRRNSRP